MSRLFSLQQSRLCHVLLYGMNSIHIYLYPLVRPTLEYASAVCIGVNRPAIVREIPHFGLLPAFPHFCENVPHFWLYFETTKFAENRNNCSCTETFCSKIFAKTSMIASPCFILLKNTSKIAEIRNNFHCRRHFVRKSALKRQ